MLKDDGYPKPDYYFYKKYYDKKRDTTSFVMFRSDTRDQIKSSTDLSVLRGICREKGVPLFTYEEEQEQEMHKKTNQVEKRRKILEMMPDPEYFFVKMSYNKSKPKYLLHRPGFKPLLASFSSMDALEEYVNDKYPGVPLLSPEEYKARKSVPVNTLEYYVRDVATSTGVKYQLMKSFPNSNWSDVYIDVSDSKEDMEMKADLLNNRLYIKDDKQVPESDIVSLRKRYQNLVGDIILINDEIIIEKNGRFLKNFLYENYHNYPIKKCEEVVFKNENIFDFSKENLILDKSKC